MIELYLNGKSGKMGEAIINLIKKKIKANKDKELKKILTNSKKVRKQIIDWKQDVSKPDFGREI